MNASTYTIAISGHRSLSAYRRPLAVIQGTIRRLVGLHPGALWLAGGAVGVDQAAVGELLELSQRVRLVLPFPVHIQAAQWAPADRATLQSQVEQVEAVQVVRQAYHPGAFHERNRRLVRLADLVVAFWDERPAGGTAATVCEAHRQGVPVLVVPLLPWAASRHGADSRSQPTGSPDPDEHPSAIGRSVREGLLRQR